MVSDQDIWGMGLHSPPYPGNHVPWFTGWCELSTGVGQQNAVHVPVWSRMALT